MRYNKKGHYGLFIKLTLSAITGLVLCSIWYAFTIPDLTPSDLQSDIAEYEKEETSGVVSRLERIKMYQDRYRYKTPTPFRNHTARDGLCGAYPDYTKWFDMKDDGPDSIRSYKDSHEDQTIYNIFFKDEENQIKGSVVEMGAFTGLRLSNSHFFDQCLGWETMLVEGNPLHWDNLVANRPHAHRFSYVPSCTEEDEIANKTIKFDNFIWANGGVADGSVKTAFTNLNATVLGKNLTVDAPCGSLTKVLRDVFPEGHVSFFSLDVEGAEPFILEKIDFDNVFIEIFMIETFNSFCREGCKTRAAFRKILLDAGYELFEGMVIKSDVFIHPLSKHLKTAKEKNFSPSLPSTT